MPEDADTPELLAEYRRILVAMHESRLDHGGSPRHWNRLVDQMQRVHLLLRKTDEGRAGIADLVDDDCLTVRAWSATNALAWDTTRARTELERLVDEDTGLFGLNAKATLREFDSGRLRTDWEP